MPLLSDYRRTSLESEHKRVLLKLAVTLMLCAPLVSAQQGKPLSDSELAAITARGKMLAEYDVASWHATNAVVALKPAEGVVRRYIARKSDGHWVVAFGNSPEDFSVRTYTPPKTDKGFFYIGAKGIQIALENTHLERRPYNTYVLPLDSGEFYVYVLPAQTTAHVYPLGGDTRYLLSADGSKIIETRQLHKTILERKPSSISKTVAGYHTHVLTDTPEDTDVFLVLQQSPPVPEFVGTKNGTYVVNTDGTIRRVK
jgi:hypothetical protein